MPQRRFAALVLVVVVAAVSACGSSGTDTRADARVDAGTDPATATANVDGDVVAVGAAPAPGDGVGSLGDAVEVAAGAPGQAVGAACSLDRQTLEMAIEAYELLTGSVATSQQELVDAQMIRELSPNFDVGADGALVPAPGSSCS
jgi:hypothetical protein